MICSKRSNSHAGFTLSELLIVLAILSLLFTITAPSFNKMVMMSRLKSAVLQFSSTLHYAKETTVISSQTHAITIDKKNGRYYLEVEFDALHSPGKFHTAFPQIEGKLEGDIQYQNIQIIESKNLNKKYAETPRICFYGDGSSSESRIVLGILGQKPYFVIKTNSQSKISITIEE